MQGARPLYRVLPGNDPGDFGSRGKPFQPGPNPVESEELPYKVELWDANKASVEQVLAVTASAAIGFAAYFAATKEFTDRYITLRHKNSIVSRWNGPSH
jgi:hypothetical protein